MNNRPAAISVGWNLGILSGMFAVLQVLISTGTARANIATIESMRWSLARLDSGGGNPVPLIGILVPVVLITYAAMIITGVASLMLSWRAGRLTAYVNGRRSGGAGAGFQVALLSGAIWLVFSALISLVFHADGTITGVIASTRDGSSLPAQLSGLLIQEVIFAAIGLGLGAWAGYLGARSAPPPSETAQASGAIALPATYGLYPAYPPGVGYPTYTYGGYPFVASPYPQAAPYMPPHPAVSAPPPSYPPPPEYYRSLGGAITPTSTPEASQQLGQSEQSEQATTSIDPAT